MTKLDVRFANDLLNALEDLELPLLSWGVTTGALSAEEVYKTVETLLREHPGAPEVVSAEDVVRHFRDHGLLFAVPGAVPMVFRTRLAEALRLTTQLRQLFAPRRDEGLTSEGWWLRGRRLVADYRLHVTPRRYPIRDISIVEALNEFSSVEGWGESQDEVARSVVNGYDLARFQIDATRTVFESLNAGRSRGVVIGAGTGSGKTLAFYLPAFASIVERKHRGVHTIAIYPRTELLRDQLQEAVRTAERVDRSALSRNRRAIRIGVLYADTPFSCNGYQFAPSSRNRGWKRQGPGFVCPYFNCPQCGTGELLWGDNDRKAKPSRERLRCSACDYLTPDGRLALTRDSLRKMPPDLLFTTTEMLNRNSGEPNLDSLLGWRGGHSPSLVLLDEVHTYVGMHGAQVALLLRRWRHAAGKNMAFVGLSATLRNSEHFFAELTGLHPSQVERVEPAPEHLEQEGREYALALRGDPVSGASLLSTSIQCAMLFGRILDTDQYLFGTTGFIFTDDLDVTNRFYDDLRDVEGGQSRSRRAVSRKAVLAALRSPDLPHKDARYQDGQSWPLVEKIGHNLDPDLRSESLPVARTSSQDVGLDRDAVLTVATPSLEVGVNDARVGLVLQHKAPRSTSGFLQRRGRAGRQRGTRPITIVTLSDYGRDRLAYQAYETLFSPVLTVPSLPVENRFIVKIQAAQSLLDWLAVKLRRQGIAENPRSILTAPNDRTKSGTRGQQEVAVLLRGLLEDVTIRDDFAAHLQAALKISASEVEAVLWDPPRALLLGVVPTELRRIESAWKPVRSDPGAEPGMLMPEYVTKTLFSPLNLPEVDLKLPFDGVDGDEALPVAHALREAVPGRVSRRYGYQRDEHRTWLPVPPGDSNELDLNTFVLNPDPQGVWHPVDGDPVQVVRPLRINLSPPPPEVSTRSQGTPIWATEIVVPDDTPLQEGDVPSPSPWRDRLTSVAFASHAWGNPVEVRRMSTGADCVISFDGPREDQRRSVRYLWDGEPAALGFGLDVDGIRFELNSPDLFRPEVREYMESPQWKLIAFTDAIVSAPELVDLTNEFQRDWLAQIYLTAFVLDRIQNSTTAAAACASLSGGAWSRDLDRILNVMYRSGPGGGSNGATTDRLIAALSDLAGNEVVNDVLDRAGELLVEDDVWHRTTALARRVYRETMAAAILAASIRACPNAQDNDLIIDILAAADSSTSDVVWMTETSVGGLGVIEHLVRRYSQDPRAFLSLVDTTLAPGEHEYVDGTIVQLLQEVTGSPSGPAATALGDLRSARSAGDADAAFTRLREAWGRISGPPRHSAVATLSTRLLRPGSGPETNQIALELVTAWEQVERAVGVEVDARVIAYVVGSGVISLKTGRRLSADQAFSLLWPRGGQSRAQHLQHYQPYAQRPVLDRLLVAAVHDDRVPRVDLGQSGVGLADSDWRVRYRNVLAENARVDLVTYGSDTRRVAEALTELPLIPVDRDVLRLYGEVRAIVRAANEIRVRVELREAIQ